MALSSRTRRVVVCTVVVSALGYAGYVIVRRRAMHDELRVRDALQMAAPEVLAELIATHGDGQRALDKALRHLHDASVSPIWFDDSSAPVDAWGSRFRARVDWGVGRGGGHAVTPWSCALRSLAR